MYAKQDFYSILD